ncbi:MAG: FecCD family ABC transporter permease, partial [Candidatus Natronoplasma sp.]
MTAEQKNELETKTDILHRYDEYSHKRVLFFFISFFSLLALSAFALTLGPADISVSEALSALAGNSSSHTVNTIIWNIRLPRVLSAIIAGAGLAVTGVAMQSILRNPLGSPYTLGISHSAAFGAAFAVIVLGAGTLQSQTEDAVILNNPYIVTISAFAWSLVATFIILLLARLKKATPTTMVLTGVALGSLFTAGYTALQYFADDVELAAIVFWTFGDVARATWTDLAIMMAVVFPASAYFLYKSWDYEVLDSGDEAAKSLGLDVEKLRLYGMILSSLVTALIISFVGIIGFVGLVVPHMVRRVIGGNERHLIPTSCVVGAILLLASDTAARTVISPIVLPVGILTSFLGAPLFIYLVIKGREY